MQKGGILNSHIAKVLADLGHTDTICIGDCGLPIPEGVERIDLALEFGKPSFGEIVTLLKQHMQAEAIHVAGEIEEKNPENFKLLQRLYPEPAYTWYRTTHDEFKIKTANCKCIIRTGETTPYANVILQADCIFNEEK